jgi:rhamnosyltransferase
MTALSVKTYNLVTMVSVIIPTLNAEEHIHTLIASLRNQTVPCEIIVIDSSSSDNTVNIAESQGARTIVIKREDFDHGGTRNLAASHASGGILSFLTQDALPENNHFIENLVRPLGESEIAAAYGRQVPKVDAKLTEKFARLFNYPEAPVVKGMSDIPALGIKTFFFSNSCSAIRKKEFEQYGGFTEKLIMNEDMHFACRLILEGYKLAYVPEARVIHSHDYSLMSQLRRYFDIGVFLKKHLYPLTDARSDKTGALFLKEGFSFFWKNRAYTCLPYLFAEAAARYAGYTFGQHYDMLPAMLRKKISLHSSYW